MTVRCIQKWNVINVIYIQNDWILYQSGLISGVISNIYWHASKWSSISFSHWQCPSDRKFSFPRFVGLLILSLWSGLLATGWSAGNFYTPFFIECFWLWRYVFEIVFYTVCCLRLSVVVVNTSNYLTFYHISFIYIQSI
jgi:hypothetical protein